MELGINWVPNDVLIRSKVSTAFTTDKKDLCDETVWMEPFGS